LNGLVQTASSTHSRFAKEAGVTLRVDAPPEAASLDAVRVRQAVENVIQNALDHTPRGGTVHVTAARDRNWVTVIVEDTGRGFPPDFVDRAFEPLARGRPKRAGAREGAGLGLAIVRAIAEAHGGYATVENRPEGGARVTIVLRDGDGEPLMSDSPSSQGSAATVGRRDHGGR
jgi:signal transduction histidine kinase